MNFLALLAGGAEEVGDAYSKHQKEQRTFKIDQSRADAELLRKKNYARFGQKIDNQNADKQMGRQKALYDYQQGGKDSGYVDPKTGLPKTKEEVKAEGVEGLVPADEYNARRKSKVSGEISREERDAKLKEIRDKFGPESPEYKAAEAQEYGVPSKVIKKEETGELSPKEIRKEVNKTLSDVKKSQAKYKEEDGGSSLFAKIKAVQEVYINPDVAKGIKDRETRFAIRAPKIFEGIMQGKTKMTETAFKAAVDKIKIGDKPLKESEKKALLEYYIDADAKGLWTR